VLFSALNGNAEIDAYGEKIRFAQFISGIWFPLDGAPGWLVNVAHFFPLHHIVHAFGSCFVPGSTGSGFNGSDLSAIVLWTAIGLFVAVRRFRWEP
jgi:ABC-2 type transport system permease protein